MPFTIIRQDITKMKVDAIVNAANTGLAMGGGVCGSIFNAAGSYDLQVACDKLAPIKIGEAVITPGFKLPAKYIIHTAGPIYKDGRSGEDKELHSCYIKSLELAFKNDCESIAFPLISSGIYGYPKAEALSVATIAIQEFLGHNDMDVYLVVFDKAAFTISESLLGEVESYIDEHYVTIKESARRDIYEIEECTFEDSTFLRRNASVPRKAASVGAKIDDLIGNLDEPFSATLLRLIDAKGKTDVEVYKRANIDRKLFSKIRTGKGYTPGKRTALALAISMELTLKETEDLLKRAGYALSHSNKFDVIVEYFIVNGKFNIFEINEVLFQHDQPLLGG